MYENIVLFIMSFGLVYAGSGLLTTNLDKLSGSYVHELIRTKINHSFLAGFWGIMIGAIVSKTSALTSIFSSLVATRTLSLQNALTMLNWSAVGSVLLIYAVSLQSGSLMMLIFGISGILCGFVREGSYGYFIRVVFGLCLMLYGMSLLKNNSTPETRAMIQSIFTHLGHSDLLAVGFGLIAQLLLQSGLVVLILMMQLMEHQGVTLEQVFFVMCGTRLASGSINILFSLPGSRTAGKKMIMFRFFMNFAGVLVTAVPIYFEIYTGIPLILAFITYISPTVNLQVANICLVTNLLGAIFTSLIQTRCIPLLNKFYPDEKIAADQPMYLVNASIYQPYTALYFTFKEQIRFAESTYQYIEYIRDLYKNRATESAIAHKDIFFKLGFEINQFLHKLSGRLENELLADRHMNLVILQSLLSLVIQTLYQFRINLLDRVDSTFSNFYLSFIETFDVLLSTTIGVMKSLDPEDIRLLFLITEDRKDIIRSLEQAYIRKAETAQEDIDHLLIMNSLLDRYAMLIRQIASCIDNEKGFNDSSAKERSIPA